MCLGQDTEDICGNASDSRDYLGMLLSDSSKAKHPTLRHNSCREISTSLGLNSRYANFGISRVLLGFHEGSLLAANLATGVLGFHGKESSHGSEIACSRRAPTGQGLMGCASVVHPRLPAGQNAQSGLEPKVAGR